MDAKKKEPLLRVVKHAELSRGQSIGLRVLAVLLALVVGGLFIACIGYPDTEDEYLTKNSVQFHAHLGYRLAGTFYQCGYKFGRWYHMVWMEKIIGDHRADPTPVIPFSQLDLSGRF